MKNITIDILVEPLEDGTFKAASKDMPDLLVQGETEEKAVQYAQEMAQILIEHYKEENIPLPPKIQKQLDSKNRKLKRTIPVMVSL